MRYKLEKTMKRLAIIGLFILLRLVAAAQQDAQFSQYMFNGLYINPAYAGYKKDIYMHAFYRSQWTGFEGAPQSFSLALDGTVQDTKVGLGLLAANDKLGAQNSLSLYGNYAYRMPVSFEDENSILAFGLGVGFTQAGLDGSKLNAIQQGDYNIPPGYQSNLFPDARAGVLYTTDKVFASFSADNLISNWIAKSKNRAVSAPIPVPHFYLMAGMLYPLNDDVLLKPSFLLKDDIGGPTSLDLNAFVLLSERLWIGGTYRTAVPLYPKNNLQGNLQKSNALVATAQIFVSEKLRIGYAFDYSLTPLSNYNYGTHEISLGIFLKQGKLKSIGEKCYYNSY